MPITQLRQDLLDHQRQDLADKAAAGEWDGTAEEADAWAASEEGQQAYAELTGGVVSGGRGHGKKAQLDRIAANHAIKRNNPLINEAGEKLPLKDPPRMLAAVEILKDSGGADIEVGKDGAGWYAKAKASMPVVGPDNPASMMVSGFASPEAAAEHLATEWLSGKTCPFCERPVRLGGDRHDRQKVCRYKRIGQSWVKGCP